MSEPRTMSDFPEVSREDTISVTLDVGPAPDKVEFVLEASPFITWWKAIELRARDGALLEQVETQDSSHGPRGFAVPAATLIGTRLVLAKAKIFGIHTGMYHLENLSALRGRSVRFLWQRDDDRDGPVAGFFHDLGHAIAAAADAVAGVVEDVVNAIGEFLAGLVSAIGNFLADAIEAIGNFLANIPIIGPALQLLFHWVSTIVSALFEFVATVIRGVLNIVSGVVAGIIRLVLGGLGGLIAWDARVFVKGFGDLVAGIVGGVIAIVGTLLALIQSVLMMQWGERPLNQMEFGLLTRIYRGSVNLSSVRIIEGFAGFLSINNRPFTLGNRIYMKDVSSATRPDILAHECCHVWQSQREGTRYIADALWAQAAVTDAYSWEAEVARGHARFEDFNKEAQASFIENVFMEGRRVPPRGTAAEFYDDDPIGEDVEFRRTPTLDQTGLARGSILYVRGG